MDHPLKLFIHLEEFWLNASSHIVIAVNIFSKGLILRDSVELKDNDFLMVSLDELIISVTIHTSE